MERFQELAATSGTPGDEVPAQGPLFACHKSDQDNSAACAGWLASVGHEHIGVRIAVAQGRLDAAALQPGEDWPELHPTFADMVAHQALPDATIDAAREDLADEVLEAIRNATPIYGNPDRPQRVTGWCIRVVDGGDKCIDVLPMLTNFRVVLSDREYGRLHKTYSAGWCYFGHGVDTDGRRRTLTTAQAAAFLAAAAWDGTGAPAGADKQVC